MYPICGPYEVISSSRDLLYMWRPSGYIEMILES